MKTPIFYMMVGFPASGKSSVAESLGATVRSSDGLRVQLLGDVEDMSQNKAVFDILHSLIKADLYNGIDTVYDATNLKAKYRKDFLEELSLLPCKKVCIYVKTPYTKCVKRNIKRDRTVPFEVMDRMYGNFDTPDISEGWDEIQIRELISKEEKEDGGDR